MTKPNPEEKSVICENGEINAGNWFQTSRCFRTLKNKVYLKKTILKKAEENKVKKMENTMKGRGVLVGGGSGWKWRLCQCAIEDKFELSFFSKGVSG
jgi:hypothetical protein